MKPRYTALAALMMCAFVATSQAQMFYPKLQTFTASDKERMDKVYADCLSTRHDAIIQDALAIVAMMKLDVPAEEFPRIKDEIDDLVISNSAPIVRYKAYLAGAVFANPSFFKEETKRLYNDPDAFFRALAERMAKSLLTSL